ncbi:MAG: serine hydrolase [Clostridiales bacterium]|nr:serine hydrolase [Clostridiales bacterium]
MKNPKSNYIGEARRIKRNRMIIRSVIAGIVILVIGFALFFSHILNLKKDIDSEFPSSEEGSASTQFHTTPTDETDLSSDPEATKDTGATSGDPSGDTSATGNTEATEDPGETKDTEGSLPETNETGDGEDDPTEPESTPTTTVSLLPDEWPETEPVLFPQKYPLQTVTHAERDQSYANMKQAVKKYIEEHKEARIGFYYINLSTAEAFGYNEASPFVVGSSIYLPISTMLYDDVKNGRRSLKVVSTFNSSYLQEGTSSSMKDVPNGKQFYVSQLIYKAVHEGDSAAMAMILDYMGGADDVLSRLSQTTFSVDFTSVQNYVDYKGRQQSGIHRSSPYDLANYAEELYWSYMSYPGDYQGLINALYDPDHLSGIGKNFPADTLVLHRAGSNTEFHSESDVAIILSSEPVVVCVTAEAATPAEAEEIQAALGALVYNFISYCHA